MTDTELEEMKKFLKDYRSLYTDAWVDGIGRFSIYFTKEDIPKLMAGVKGAKKVIESMAPRGPGFGFDINTKGMCKAIKNFKTFLGEK